MVTRRSKGQALAYSELRRLRKISQVLSARYGDPRLGNKEDPLDELFYIILSGKTAESSFSRTYESLHSRFPDWFEILHTPIGTVATLITSGGLARKKESQLRGLLEELQRRGATELRKTLIKLDDPGAEQYLSSLPGVGTKTARCVLMYSLGRRVFPVDAHVNRVLSRLGFASNLRLTDREQDLIQERVPCDIRYSLHVNLIAHGRQTCKPARPKCETCPVAKFCDFWRLTERSGT